MGLLTVVGSIGGTTGAFNLLTQSSALAASTLPASTPLAFEDADGNMVCDGTGGGAGCTGTTPNYLDWGSSYVNTSPAFLNEPDTDAGCTSQDLIFTQGTKEDNTSPTITCAPSTPKVALSQAYAWHQTIGSDQYLYLAWEAPNQSGSNNNHIDFELNQQPQNYPYSSTNPITGSPTWTLNRTKGDLLFDFDITPAAPEICYQVWDPTLNSGAGGWGPPANPTYDTNCTQKNGEGVLSGAQAAVGGGFTDPINSASLASGAFGEMGIDLTAAGLFQPGVCTNFTNVWVKGRSSGSGGTSELKSFIAPQGVTVENCTQPGFTTQVSPTTSAALGSGASWTDSATVTGNADGGAPGGSVDFNLCSETTPGTPCSSGGTHLASVAITSAMQNSSTNVTTVPLPAANAQTPHAAGTYCFWASYTAPTSNTKYLSVSPETNPQNECFTVTPASTTVTTAAGSGIVVGSGGSVTDTANVFSSGGVALAAGDTVQFYLCKISSSTGQTGSCAATAGNADGSAVAVSGTPSSSGTTSAVHATSPSVSPTTAGSYCFSAVFSAPNDPNYTGSSENTTGSGVAAECFNVNPASTSTVTQTSGNVTLSPTGSATDTANIFSTGGQPLAAGDNVQFYLCKVSSSTGQVGSCAATAGNADGSPVAVSGTPSASGTTSAVQAVSPSVTPTSAGSYCFSAVFSTPSDPNYTGSSENTTGSGIAAECFSVSPASTTVVTQTSGNVTLSPTGSATDTANIFSTGGQPLAAGDNVQFYLCKISSTTGQVGSCAATAGNADGSPVAVSGTPSASGTTSAVQAVSPSVTPTSAGSYCFSAVFSTPSDPNYTGSSENTTGSGVAAECFSVAPASTTTTTTASGSVTLSPSGSATDTANIFSTGGVPLAAGDTVQFYLCKVSGSTGQVGSCAATAGNADGSPVAVSGTPSASGTTSAVHATSPSVTPTSVGSYCFSAVFNASGDPNYTGSSENTTGTGVAAECFSVNPASTTTVTQTSGNVTLSPTGSATDTANIFSTGGQPLAAGDNVQFYLCKVSSSTGQVGSCAATAGNADGSPVAVSGTPSASGTTSAVQAVSPSVTPTSAGSYCFSAVFSTPSDPNYTGSSENTTGSGIAAECFSVAPASTTVVTQTSGSVTLSPTGSATDTANIFSTGGVPLAAGDTVQFYLCKISSTTGQAGSCAATAGNADGSPVAVSGTPSASGTTSAVQAVSPSVTPTSVGSYCFSAVFNASGDPNYTGSSENTSGDGIAAECFSVNPASTTTVTQTSGDVTLSPTGSATDTANIFSTGGVPLAAGDTVQFYLCKVSGSTGVVGSCAATAGNADGSPVAVSGTPSSSGTTSAVQAVSPSVTPTSVGSYCFSAVFNAGGDVNYTGSSENTTGTGIAAECFSVAPTATTVTTTASGNVTLSPTGSATDTANVFSTGGVPLAAGDSVQFYVCKVSSSTGQVGSCAATAGNADGSPVAVSGTPSSSGTTSAVQATSPTVTPTSAGSYCFSAVLNTSGDPNYTGSSDNTTGAGVAAECFSVSPASTSTTTTASGSVTLSPTGSATDTANVFSTGGVPLAAGDSVQFYVCKVSNSTGAVGSCAASAGNADGSPVAVSGTPSSSGTTSAVQATSPSVTPTSAGSYCFSAVFNATGDPNYTGSSENTTGDGVAAECFSVSPASTTTTTQTSGTVTLSPTGSAFDTATISSTGGVPLASGDTVQFYVCKVSSSTGVVGSCAASAGNADGSPVAVSGTPQPSGSGSPLTVQSPTVDLTTPGSYCFSAVFSTPSDINYTGSSENTSGDGVAAECFDVLQPNFTVAKTDTPGDGNPVSPGATIPYTVTITNTGDGAGSATVADNAPSNETVSGTPLCGALTGTDACQVNGSGNDWTITVSLAAGDSVQVTFSAVVSATANTDVVNTASITSGVCTEDCSSTVTNPVPNITVVKSVKPASGTAVFPGDTLTYSLTVTNNGSGTGTETVNDAAPTNTTLVAGSAACGTAPAGGSCSVTSPTGTLGWSVTLAADTSMTVSFQVKVNADDTATITNFGTFSGPGCGTPANTDVATTPCSTNTVNNPVIVLSAVKSSVPASGSTVSTTQTVTYSITLSNAGTGTATDVTLTDAIPTGTTYVAGSASCGGAPGCSVSEAAGTVTWTGLNVAPGTTSAITVTFQVTVDSTDTNGQVITNFGVFTNEGTPGCTGSTCNTNTVTLTVVVPAVTPTPQPPIVAATTVHTGQPWAGSRPIEILALLLGLGLIAIGELERRRARRLLARRHVD